MEQKIPSPAVIRGCGLVKQAYIGTEAVSTVYTTELKGIQMALELPIQLTTAYATKERAIIFSDSQAALQAIRNPSSSGQYILVQIMGLLEYLQRLQVQAEMHWITAHQGIEGNERADQAAKEAIGRRSTQRRAGHVDRQNELPILYDKGKLDS
ncbi:hypothetical protein EYZ11_010322 [Aspergillus tanneri]|uniref:RNase H type-1 domain-containing protein n=1 Tax=Aspergillus tanneri TaxID=1220188 RepID=A0A4S3J672_9EURO|nr:hypothetical protein EYZ11_010322 [Aspergillus tanneri]